jgi:hypothetical protein
MQHHPKSKCCTSRLSAASYRFSQAFQQTGISTVSCSRPLHSGGNLRHGASPVLFELLERLVELITGVLAAAGANAVLLHQPLHTLLGHVNDLSLQLPPDARPAVGPTILSICSADVHQQRLVAEMPAPGVPARCA